MAGKAAGKGAAAGAALGAEIGSAYPVIGTAIGAVVGAIIGATAGWISGVKDNRIDGRQQEMFDAFKKSKGYGWPVSYHQYKLGKSRTKPKSDDGKEYAKLAARMAHFIHDRLEWGNPGLGEWWARNYPMRMVNMGNINQSSMDGFKKALTIPGGTFTKTKPADDMNVAAVFSGIANVVNKGAPILQAGIAAYQTFGQVKSNIEAASQGAKPKSAGSGVNLYTGSSAAPGTGSEWYKNPVTIIAGAALLFFMFGKKLFGRR